MGISQRFDYYCNFCKLHSNREQQKQQNKTNKSLGVEGVGTNLKLTELVREYFCFTSGTHINSSPVHET